MKQQILFIFVVLLAFVSGKAVQETVFHQEGVCSGVGESGGTELEHNKSIHVSTSSGASGLILKYRLFSGSMKTHIMNEENVDRMNNGETYDAGWSVEPRNGCDTIYMKMSESDTYYFYGVCDSYDGCKVAIALMEVCSHENEAACKNDDNGYGCGWCKGVHYSSNDICVPAGNYDGDVGYGIECRDYVNFKSGGDGGNNDDGSGDFPFILVMVMMIVVVTMVIVCGSFYWAKGLQKKIQGRIRGQLSDIRNQQVPVLLGGNPTGVSIGVLPNGEAMTMDTQTQNYLRAQQGLPPLLSTDAQNYINAQEGKPLEMNAQETNFINSQRIQRDQQQRQQQQQQQQQQQHQQQQLQQQLHRQQDQQRQTQQHVQQQIHRQQQQLQQDLQRQQQQRQQQQQQQQRQQQQQQQQRQQQQRQQQQQMQRQMQMMRRH